MLNSNFYFVLFNMIMKNLFRWASLVVLFALFSCTQIEKTGDVSLTKPGVYGYIPPMVSDDAPGTKATVNPANMQLSFEVSDKINIWSETGTLLIYSVKTLTGNGGALFDGGGFDLTDGMTYYSSYPLIASVRDDFNALTTTYEGQVQKADGDASHISEFTYTYSSAVCENGSTSFGYHYLTSWLRFELTLPKTMTVTELTLTADSDLFALNGTVDVTTGTFTPGEMSDTMTLRFDDVTVSDGVLNAFMALNPFASGTFVIRVKDSEGNVYVSGDLTPANPQNAILAGKYRTIRTAMTEEEPVSRWEKVTETAQLTSGDYVIVYPTADVYKVFSFEKAMANAQTAAAMVANKHTFAEVAPMRTQLFQTCVNGDYETVAVPEDPDYLDIPEEIEASVAIEATTLTGETANGSAVLKSTVKNLGFRNVVVSLGEDGEAIIKGMVNASDFKDVCTYLRGHELKFTFTDVMDFVAAEVGMSDASKEDALKAFDGLCQVAQSVMAEHDFLPLMDIDRSTKLMDVFETHYEFFADAFMAYDSDKAMGWLNPVGFYVENDGFSAHIPVPSSWWFDLFAESLATGSREGFVAYWQQFDIDHPEYSQYFSRSSFFGRIAEKMIEDNTVTVSQFNKIAAIDWAQIGQKYQVYVDDLNNDPLVEVYLYKKVSE